MNKKYLIFKEQTEKIADINYASGVLNWDQETYIPKKGVGYRAQQLATLSALAHEMSTSQKYGEMIDGLLNESDLSDVEKANVKLSKKDYDRSIKLPTEYVIRLSKATSEAFHSWIKAREANNFELYIPSLKKMVDLQREKAEIYGYEDHPYNALMDAYEPDAKVAEIDTLFEDVRKQLSPFIQKIFAKSKPSNEFMFQNFPHKEQWSFGLDMLTQIGFDFDAGRQDLSEHPFTTSFSPLDVRLTTRVDENNLYDMFWSCIHEGGHGLYEQGLSPEQYGMPCGSAVSLGIHESQSRMYENNIARSMPYWKANYPSLQATFKKQLGAISLDKFYKGINMVEPSLIRTDADELTYHFHIMIRYEIEKKLIEGSIQVEELKDVWNAAYKEYLNIDVPDDKQGVLQDIHWAHGGFGYFPTYSLGSFYAAQFYNQAKKDIPNLETSIEQKDMKPLLEWLRKNIHQYGRRFNAQELCEKATGEALNFKHFMDYAKSKYGSIYNL